MLYWHDADQTDIFRRREFVLARNRGKRAPGGLRGTAARTPRTEIGSLNRMRSHQLYINGAWVAPHSGETFQSINPFTGEAWAEIGQADEVDVRRAVDAARNA